MIAAVSPQSIALGPSKKTLFLALGLCQSGTEDEELLTFGEDYHVPISSIQPLSLNKRYGSILH